MSPNARTSRHYFLSHGFTLLEVMVALVAFAIAALALLNTQNTQVTTDQHMEEKTLAHWVALNQLAEMRLHKEFPDIGEKKITAKMADRDWLITIKSQSTPVNSVHLVQVSVALKPGDSSKAASPVTMITGFLARAKA